MPCWRRRRRRTRRGRRRFEEFEGGEREGSQMKIVGGGGPVDAEHLSFEFYARWVADAYTRENNTWSKRNYEQKIVDKAQMQQGLLRESCVYLQMRSSPTTARTWPFPQSVEGTPHSSHSTKTSFTRQTCHPLSNFDSTSQPTTASLPPFVIVKQDSLERLRPRLAPHQG